MGTGIGGRPGPGAAPGRIGRACRAHGLTPTQYNVLRILRGAGERGLCRNEVRERLGESVATIEKYSRPLQEATTASLDAWKAFTTATQVFASSGRARAIPLFERAIAIVEIPEVRLGDQQIGIAAEAGGNDAEGIVGDRARGRFA